MFFNIFNRLGRNKKKPYWCIAAFNICFIFLVKRSYIFEFKIFPKFHKLIELLKLVQRKSFGILMLFFIIFKGLLELRDTLFRSWFKIKCSNFLTPSIITKTNIILALISNGIDTILKWYVNFRIVLAFE